MDCQMEWLQLQRQKTQRAVKNKLDAMASVNPSHHTACDRCSVQKCSRGLERHALGLLSERGGSRCPEQPHSCSFSQSEPLCKGGKHGIKVRQGLGKQVSPPCMSCSTEPLPHCCLYFTLLLKLLPPLVMTLFSIPADCSGAYKMQYSN